MPFILRKHLGKISTLSLTNNILKIFIPLLIFVELFFDPILMNANAFQNSIDYLSNCRISTNCILQNWKVEDNENAFNEIIEILENTPRVKIIKINNDYIHAISTSRIMKFIDDIEIKKISNEKIFQVKSESRKGFVDFGVNKRRIETLHFRLIDIYN